MSSIWAIADLHLSFGVPGKAMDLFGPQWQGHPTKIKEAWCDLIAPEDLILIPGDISWAMTPEEARADLEWIHQLPGTKVLLRGNHDYWWSSLSKVEKVLPPSLHLIQNNSFLWGDVAIGGAKLWDSAEYEFGSYIVYRENPQARKTSDVVKTASSDEKLFLRELQRLETSFKSFSGQQHKMKIAMTHYPPIGADLHSSQASAVMEKYRIDIAAFGHLHNVKPQHLPFGSKNGVSYVLTACDYLNFIPLKLA